MFERLSRASLRITLILASALVLAVCSPIFAAQPAPKVSQARLTIYTKPIEPFVFVTKGKVEKGFSVDLWQEIAKRLKLQYNFTCVKSTPDILSAVQKDESGIGVAAISINSEREAILDFSHPYFDSGLQVLTSGSKSPSLLTLITGIFRGDLLRFLLIILATSFVTANLIWLSERKRNPDSFPGGYWQGIGEALWFAVSTLFAGGCEEKSPRTFGGRFFTFIWLIVSIVLVSYFTASLTSALTVEKLNGEINGPNDLPGKVVATVKGSTSEDWLKQDKAKIITCPDVEAAVDALVDGRAKAVVYDSPLLRYQVSKRHNGALRLVGTVFAKQSYGIALPIGSPYRKAINEQILALDESGFMADLDRKYFGNRE